MLCSQVIGVEVEHSHHESHKHCHENHHEFKDVLHSSSQRDLQGSEALVGRENVRNARKAQHNRNGVEAFRDELRVRRQPVDSC